MFLHIGESISIYKDDIIAILDKKCLSTSSDNKVFIKNMLIEDKIGDDSIKTYIIAKEGKEYRLYTSNISSMTLLNRK